MQPLVTVITVTYNAASVVEETVLSVLQQKLDAYEYLVIDGASSDDTLQILERYKDKIRLVSEPDKGIYDAMNKGISMAGGTWIYFLNAGDMFFDPMVLHDIFSKTIADETELIYGKVRTRNHPSGVDLTIGEPVSLKDFYYRVGLCHQAVFTHQRAFLKLGNYNSKEYRILADQEWFVRFFLEGRKAEYSDRIIAWYETTGLSSIMRRQNHREHLKIVKSYFNARVKFWNLIRNPMVLAKIYLLKKINNTMVYRWYRKLFFNN